jgi:hypothetical protein
MARTHASFDADDETFPTDGEPAGHELAEYVHAALHGAGFDPGEPEEREGWAWDVAERDRYSVVGLTDDPPAKWQIHTYGKDVAGWCEAVHAGLVAHAGVRDVRWFEPDEDDDWADTPG